MEFIFFSLRNFVVDVGESVRIYGLLNTLASQGKQVVFISNAKKYDQFHPDIKHVFIDFDFKKKRVLQGLLALLPATLVYHKYIQLFRKVELTLKAAEAGNKTVYFFDYLDNSIGYILKRRGLIAGYINDIHGITTLEFLSHIQNAGSVRAKMLYRAKYKLANRLDKKVFQAATGFIFGSNKMQNYYRDLYGLREKKNYIIPYVLGQDAVNRKVEERLKQKLLQELLITPQEFVILFVGSYKATAGVDDLINAFELLFKEYRTSKLILIGNGPYKEKCVKLVEGLESARQITFIEHIPYTSLITYQSLADVVVCPDKENLFSQYVIHVKYFDALISGKLVINGDFESVREVNKNDFLSLSFKPSDVNDLHRMLKRCVEEREMLEQKYMGVKEYAAKNLTYHTYVKVLSDDPLG